MSLTTVYVSSLDIQSIPNTIRTRSSSSIKTSGSIGVLSIDKTAPTIEFKRKSVGVYSGSDPNFELSVPITRQYSSYGLDSEGNDANTFIGYTDLSSSGNTSITLPVFANNNLLRAKTILDISSSTKPKSFSATSVNKDLKILSIDKTNLLQRDTAFDIVNEDNDPRLDRSPRPAGETQQQSNNNVVVAQTQIWI